MGKKPTNKCLNKCLKNCEKHHFIMKPVDYFAYMSRDVQASFCPVSASHQPIFPVFNRDRKYYTSSFCLQIDQTKYQVRDTKYKNEHDKFCMEQLHSRSEMLQPKPRSKFSYCHVCKDHFDDYAEHIGTQRHKTSLSLNQSSAYIQDLIAQKYPHHQPSLQPMHKEEQLPEERGKMPSLSATCSTNTSLDETKQNLGFTLVSGQGLCESMGSRARQFRGEAENEGVLEPLSPQFEKLLRKCSSHSNVRSEKKSPSLSKFPIVLSFLE